MIESIDGPPVATPSGRHVPTDIKDMPIWVLWDLREKVALAPWLTGHCYRALWNKGLDEAERPEVTYEEVAIYAGLPPAELDRTHSFPRTDENDRPIDNPVPERVAPTILLPHESRADAVGAARCLMYIDFDDVRDPESGKITEEVADILARLDSYTEVSRSENGLHVLVFATLPDGVPAVTGDDLNERGSIEMYDHARFFGATWEHVEGTPTDVNNRQEVVNELVKQYYRGSDDADDNRDENSEPDRRNSSDPTAGGTSGSSGSRSRSRSPYFDVDTDGFAAPQPVEVDTDGRKQGAHPTHGKTTGGNRSTNYNLDTKSGQWHCFAHQSGGGAMEMAAIMANTLNCREAGAGALSRLSDDDFLKTCLYARDNLAGFTADMTPPYRALVTVARRHSLPMRVEDDGVLGRLGHKYARAIYDEMTAGDL